MNTGLARNGAPLALLCAVALAPLAARADVVLLKNGDRISGTIVSADGGKVTITPDFDPTSNITVKQADIATFSSPKAMVIKLANGAVINQPVQTGAVGQIRTAAGGELAPQAVPLDSIAKINPNYGWTGSVAANGLYSHALQDTAQIGVTGELVKRTDNDKIDLSAGYLYADQKVGGVTSTSANSWFVAGQYNYYITKPFYVYATTKFDADRVNLLSLRITPGVGAGYAWIADPDMNFSTEGGISYVREEYTTGAPTQSNAAVRLAYHFDKAWSGDRVKLYSDAEVLPSVQGGGNYLADGDLGMRVGLTKTMFSNIEADLVYDNQPAPGAQQLTTKYILGLGWTF